MTAESLAGLEVVRDVAVTANTHALIVGQTFAPDFPVACPLQALTNLDGFISAISPNGQTLVFSTPWGGAVNDRAYGLDYVDGGRFVVVGETSSFVDFPIVGADQPNAGGAGCDGFLSIMGTGDVNLSPNGLNFGLVPAGQTRTLKIAAQNTGEVPVTISSIAVQAPFSITSVLPITVAPGTSGLIRVTFSPTTAGVGFSQTGKMTTTDIDETSIGFDLKGRS